MKTALQGTDRARQSGYSLLELVVALALMTTVLLIATLVEMNLLKSIRRAEARLPSMDVVLAARQITRDVREATDLLPGELVDSVEGAQLLLLKRSAREPDQLILYRMIGNTLTRSHFLQDGTVLSEDRVLARDLLRCRLQPTPEADGVRIELFPSKGVPTRTLVRRRTHPSAIPAPPGATEQKGGAG